MGSKESQGPYKRQAGGSVWDMMTEPGCWSYVRKGPWARNAVGLQKPKRQGNGFLPKTPGEMEPCWHLDFSFQKCKTRNLYCFKPPSLYQFVKTANRKWVQHAYISQLPYYLKRYLKMKLCYFFTLQNYFSLRIILERVNKIVCWLYSIKKMLLSSEWSRISHFTTLSLYSRKRWDLN